MGLVLLVDDGDAGPAVGVLLTYTTTGDGDLLLPVDWRLLGGVEALTGILLCGWSTGFFFAVVSRLEGANPNATRP